jgi:outer membrane protein OmpA-like peptidoglycan-associated protein
MTDRRALPILLLIIGCILTSGCHHDFKQRYNALRTDLEIARERGGQWCAAKDFASAEAFLYLAKSQEENRNTKLGLAYLDYVKGHVSSALSKCSDCQTDLDFDGIRDIDDSDPYRAEDYDGWQDQDGIPDPDNDGDGFLDSEDACPNSPEDLDGWQDSDGCPEIDNDMDTIPDGRDKCPMAVEDIDGWEDEDGCPDPDNDFDMIPDADDACPNAPETFNDFLDDDGCPDFIPKKRKIIRLPKVTFIGNSLNLTSRSVTGLESFAKVYLLASEELYVRLESYTDRRGTTETLKQRTKDRAEEIKRILVEYGLDADHITTFGFGRPSKPTKRSGYWVEFVIYQR